MIWDWLRRIALRTRSQRAFDAEMAEYDAMRAALDRRIRETFTPEEWAATEERCLRKLAEMGVAREP
jgi:hypothetical protein